MPLLRSYVAYVCGARAKRRPCTAKSDAAGHGHRIARAAPIAHREKIPKSIRYTVDYILFNKLEVFINNQ